MTGRRAKLAETLYVDVDAAGAIVLTDEDPDLGVLDRIEIDPKAWEALCLYMSRQGAADGD